VVDSGSNWTVTEVAGGYQVAVTLGGQLPTIDSLPELVADGTVLGPATESADGLTLSLTTTDPTVATAKSVTAEWTSGAPIDVSSPSASRVAGGSAGRSVTRTSQPVAGTGPTVATNPAAATTTEYLEADYNFGAQAQTLTNLAGHLGEVQGRIYLPVTHSRPHPLVIFLHGRHGSCYQLPTQPKQTTTWPCPTGYGIIDSYAGYDGAGQALASQGDVVVSIGADAINSFDGTYGADAGAAARGQEILTTLTWLQKANAGEPVVFHDAQKDRTVTLTEALADGDTVTGTSPLPAGQINAADLVGTMTFTDIGVMGHSRGGEGAATAVSLNAGLAHPWHIKSAFLLAPIDFTRDTVPGVITTTLLPYCDGDVSTQQGQHFYADSRNNTFDDDVLRSDIWVMGTDHDFYNQDWTPPTPGASDDWGGTNDPETSPICGLTAPTTQRLSASQEFAVGSAYVAAFFELTLGNQTQYMGMFDGEQAEPATLQPFTTVRTVTNQPSATRETVATFAQANSPYVSTSGSATQAVCASRDQRTVTLGYPPCTVTFGNGANGTTKLTNQQQPYWTPASYAPNVPLNAMTHLSWTAVSTTSRTVTTYSSLTVTVPPSERDVSRFAEMTVNMSPDQTTNTGTGLTVTVTDGTGHSWTGTAAALNKWSVDRMPTSSTTTYLKKLVLQQVRVPTSTLSGAGVNLANVSSVKFTAAKGLDNTTGGGVYLQDLTFDSPSLGTPDAVNLPKVDLSSIKVNEGSGPHTDEVAVHLDEPASTPVTTYLSTIGSATGSVGIAVSPVTFAPGTTCQVVTVPATGNSTPSASPSTSYKIAVSDPNDAVLGLTDFGTITVREDDGVTGGTPLPNFGTQGTACAEYQALSHPGTLKVVGSGLAGTSVAITGSGYRPNESVAFADGTVPLGSATASASGTVSFVATVPGTASGTYSGVGAGSGYTSTGTASPAPTPTPAPSPAPTPPAKVATGYWEAASDGGIFAFGGATFYGSMGGTPLNAPVVNVAATPDDGGYWEVASDGGVFAFGDAGFYGSMGGTTLNATIMDLVPTPDGKGYWEVGADGGIFAFGDATFYGSMGGTPLNSPVVALAATPDGKGYWEVGADGGVFAFGDAGFYGSMGGTKLNATIRDLVPTPDGKGYWEVGTDGGIFAFGDAGFYGSMGGTPLNATVVAIADTDDGQGYWEVGADGGIFAFGDAPYFGSMGGQPLDAPIVGMATS